MMLWRGEMKKTLMTQRGIWVLLVCLVLKLAFLCAFPEQKDRRIVLSQKQTVLCPGSHHTVWLMTFLCNQIIDQNADISL